MVVILKPTLNCNIKCRHCYIGDAVDFSLQMAEEDLFFVLKSIPANSEVVIHGGEPTLMGVEYYNNVLKYFNHRFSIQTNLTLIDTEWVRTIKEIFNSRISTSYDVVGNIRVVSPSVWINNVNLLKKNNIYPYVVSVFHKGNVGKEVEIYKFFADLNLSFRLNYIMNIGRATKDKNLRHKDTQYAKALINIFNLWFLSKDKIIVDPLMEIIEAMLLGNSLSKCPFTSKCAISFVSVNPSGDVIPCGGFEFYDLKYGNIFQQNWDSIMKSENRLEAVTRAYRLPLDCQVCDWVGFCGGGCRLEAISSQKNMFQKSSICGDLKILFSFLENVIDKNFRSVYDWYLDLMSTKKSKTINDCL